MSVVLHDGKRLWAALHLSLLLHSNAEDDDDDDSDDDDASNDDGDASSIDEMST